PKLDFGPGKIERLPAAAGKFGAKVLLVTGARSFMGSTQGQALLTNLRETKITVAQHSIGKEPSPALIDEAVNKFSDFNPDCVIAVGGGSAIDAGKAISAMLPLRQSVKDYLEGVGKYPQHPGVKVPFIAVPTTSG